jgi:hypothetical protein
MKIHKIANKSATTEGREKIGTNMESKEFYEHFEVCLTKFIHNQILIYKISHRFLMTRLFTG